MQCARSWFIPSPHFRILLLVLVPLHVQDGFHEQDITFTAQMITRFSVYPYVVIVTFVATAVRIHILTAPVALYHFTHFATSLFANPVTPHITETVAAVNDLFHTGTFHVGTCHVAFNLSNCAHSVTSLYSRYSNQDYYRPKPNNGYYCF